MALDKEPVAGANREEIEPLDNQSPVLPDSDVSVLYKSNGAKLLSDFGRRVSIPILYIYLLDFHLFSHSLYAYHFLFFWGGSRILCDFERRVSWFTILFTNFRLLYTFYTCGVIRVMYIEVFVNDDDLFLYRRRYAVLLFYVRLFPQLHSFELDKYDFLFFIMMYT